MYLEDGNPPGREFCKMKNAGIQFLRRFRNRTVQTEKPEIEKRKTEKRWLAVVSSMALETFLFRLQYDTGVKWEDGSMPWVGDIKQRLNEGDALFYFIFGKNGIADLSMVERSVVLDAKTIDEKLKFEGEDGLFEVLRDTLFVEWIGEELR